MTVHTSRRALFGGAGLIAVAALTKCASTSAHAAAINPRLLRVIALHDRAQAACDRYEAEVETPAHNAFAAAKASYPVEALPPHRESASTFINCDGESIRLSTKNAGTVGAARRVAHDPSWSDMGEADWREAHISLAAAADERDAIIKAQEERRSAFVDDMRSKLRIDAISNRSTVLSDREYNLWHLAIITPAASLSDVMAKLNFVDRAGRANLDSFVLVAISADVRRLAGEA